MGDATLVYDEDCGFCRWCVRKILAWDRGRRLDPLPLQSPEADRLLPGMKDAVRASSWHLVARDGAVYSAGAAAAPLLTMLPGGRPLAAMARAFPKTTERLYRGVADHRDRLGRLVRAESCVVEPRSRTI